MLAERTDVFPWEVSIVVTVEPEDEIQTSPSARTMSLRNRLFRDRVSAAEKKCTQKLLVFLCLVTILL